MGDKKIPLRFIDIDAFEMKWRRTLLGLAFHNFSMIGILEDEETIEGKPSITQPLTELSHSSMGPSENAIGKS